MEKKVEGDEKKLDIFLCDAEWCEGENCKIINTNELALRNTAKNKEEKMKGFLKYFQCFVQNNAYIVSCL